MITILHYLGEYCAEKIKKACQENESELEKYIDNHNNYHIKAKLKRNESGKYRTHSI